MMNRVRCRSYRSGSILSVLALAAAPSLLAQPAAPKLFFASGGGSYLGVGVADIDSERASELKLKEARGVEITSVAEDTPAHKAGIQKGDVVLDYSGTRVEGMEQFVRLVKETPPGRTVKILVSRGGSTQTLNATVAARDNKAIPRAFIGGVEIPRPEIWIPDIPRAFTSWRSSMLGIEAEGLDGQLAEYFGVKEGVLVRSVMRDTPAEKAGLKAGDVIVKAEGNAVSSPRELSSALRNRSGQTLALTLMRDKRETSVSVPVDQQRSGGGSTPSRRITQQRWDENF